MRTVWRILIEEPEITLPWMLDPDNGRIAIGWGEIGDIRQLGTFDAIAAAIRERNANHPDHVGRPEANVQHGATRCMTSATRCGQAIWSLSATGRDGGVSGRW